MSIKKFLKDKLYILIPSFFLLIFLSLFFFAFKVDTSLLIVTLFLFIALLFFSLTFDYIRKRQFYKTLLTNIEQLDKAYLVLEMINKPTFYEGKLFYQALYTINKSMTENVGAYEEQVRNFKEYIEMWIHEVKLPISSLLLMIHNQKEKIDKKWLKEIKRIEDTVEQVLYYVRSENATKDYLITEVSLDKVIKAVALKNKDYLLENKIDLHVSNVQFKVFTDTKWLEFILNQIVNNSMKYKRENVEAYIKIEAEETNDKIILHILDNGIGIPTSDLPRVFDKSFTGHNGRLKGKATGMGLFIAKKMCKELGHTIEMESQVEKYTKVSITFPKNRFYEVVR